MASSLMKNQGEMNQDHGWSTALRPCLCVLTVVRAGCPVKCALATSPLTIEWCLCSPHPLHSTKHVLDGAQPVSFMQVGGCSKIFTLEPTDY